MHHEKGCLCVILGRIKLFLKQCRPNNDQINIIFEAYICWPFDYLVTVEYTLKTMLSKTGDMTKGSVLFCSCCRGLGRDRILSCQRGEKALWKLILQICQLNSSAGYDLSAEQAKTKKKVVKKMIRTNYDSSKPPPAQGQSHNLSTNLG